MYWDLVGMVTVDGAATENETTPISYSLINTSEESIHNLLMTITDENGLDKQLTIPVSIAPGESVYDTVEVDLSEVTDTTNANITIGAEGQINTADNTKEITVGQTDLTLDTVMTETEADVCIVATVSNNSVIPADATVTVYSDVEQTEQIEAVSINGVSKENGGACTFYFKKSDLSMNEYGAAYLPVVVTSNKTDNNEDNNTEIEIIYASIDKSKPSDGNNNQTGNDNNESDFSGNDTSVGGNGNTSQGGNVTPGGNTSTGGNTTPGGNTSNPSVPDTTTKYPKTSGTKLSSDEANYKVTSDWYSNPTLEYVSPMNKKATNVTIPDTINVDGVTYKVTSVAANAFKNNKKLKNITIGINVEKIGNKAFYKCTALKNVKNGWYVNTIGNSAFYGCKTLKTIDLTMVKTIGDSAFYGCKNLKMASLYNIKKIGKKAFYNCSKLSDISLASNKLKSIGTKAFYKISKKAEFNMYEKKVKKYKKLLKKAYKGTPKIYIY